MCWKIRSVPAAIANLKALGTAVALDDFGTGYSSIGYLRRFNFDTIKIDKSLAGLVDNDEQAAALVSGTVRIANALGMAVVAEGVENEKQMKLLRLAAISCRVSGSASRCRLRQLALRQVRQC
jgi:EAL domain-containing protein (putative c-di-GMP-specific phosphodiesterase class I)